MRPYKRYAVFYAPPSGSDLAQFGADWLGWDAERGCAAEPEPMPEGWNAATRTPRKYGFHGTLKPPFRLAEGAGFDDLHRAVAEVAAGLEPIQGEPLQLSRFGGFCALVLSAPSTALADAAGQIVITLDRFRAPATEAELTRRRARGLTTEQEDYLTRYGYPYVLDEFRFHLTLTGNLGKNTSLGADLAQRTAPFTVDPFDMREICLFGEAEDGRFRIIERFPLGAAAPR